MVYFGFRTWFLVQSRWWIDLSRGHSIRFWRVYYFLFCKFKNWYCRIEIIQFINSNFECKKTLDKFAFISQFLVSFWDKWNRITNNACIKSPKIQNNAKNLRKRTILIKHQKTLFTLIPTVFDSNWLNWRSNFVSINNLIAKVVFLKRWIFKHPKV